MDEQIKEKHAHERVLEMEILLLMLRLTNGLAIANDTTAREINGFG